MRHSERHRTHRVGWLRAAVLGANDGIVSTASLIVGVAAADATRSSVLVAGLAARQAAPRRLRKANMRLIDPVPSVYTDPVVRCRLIESRWDTLDHATAAYVTQSDGCQYDRRLLRPPTELDHFLTRELDIARSLATPPRSYCILTWSM
jgi:hypothetical protein